MDRSPRIEDTPRCGGLRAAQRKSQTRPSLGPTSNRRVGGAPTCLLLSDHNDEHTLSLSWDEISAREAGWNATWLGRSTPFEDLDAYLSYLKPRAMGIPASERVEKPRTEQCERVGETTRNVFLAGRQAWIYPRSARIGSVAQKFEKGRTPSPIRQMGSTTHRARGFG